MFQYVFMRFAARRLGTRFYCPDWQGDMIFDLDDRRERTADPPRCSLRYIEPTWHYGFNAAALRIADDTDVSGYFQSTAYIADEKEVRRWFTFAPSVTSVRRKYAHVDFERAASLHVRLGDMARDPEYCVPRRDYYKRVLSRVRRNQLILVFSDEMAKARNLLDGLAENFEFIEGNRTAEDLYLMSCCRDHVTSVSSFGWWGAWLARHPDKVVISPSLRMRIGTPRAVQNSRDLQCPGWTYLPAMRPILDDYRFRILYEPWRLIIRIGQR